MKFLIITILCLAATLNYYADSQKVQSNKILDKYALFDGDWYVINKGLRPGGVIVTDSYYVNIASNINSYVKFYKNRFLPYFYSCYRGMFVTSNAKK